MHIEITKIKFCDVWNRDHYVVSKRIILIRCLILIHLKYNVIVCVCCLLTKMLCCQRQGGGGGSATVHKNMNIKANLPKHQFKSCKTSAEISEWGWFLPQSFWCWTSLCVVKVWMRRWYHIHVLLQELESDLTV